MEACSYGIIRWELLLTDSTSMMVRMRIQVLTRVMEITFVGVLGPVRAVAIHPTRPLLVTGGDDYKVKVWGEIFSTANSRGILRRIH